MPKQDQQPTSACWRAEATGHAQSKVVLQSRQFSSSSSSDTPRTKVVLQSRQLIAPRTKVVLQSRQFSSSSSPDTSRTKVVVQSRQFSASSSTDTSCTKVVLQSRQFSSSSSADFRALKLHYKVASSQLPAPQMLRLPRNLHMEVHKGLCLP